MVDHICWNSDVDGKPHLLDQRCCASRAFRAKVSGGSKLYSNGDNVIVQNGVKGSGGDPSKRKLLPLKQEACKYTCTTLM